jgi:hypothetical protein
MTAPMQPVQQKKKPVAGQGVPGGAQATGAAAPTAAPASRPPAPAAAPALPKMTIPTGSPPIGGATTTQPSPPAQQITPGRQQTPYVAQAQQRAATAQDALSSAPDRADLARQSFQQMVTDSEPAFDQSIRKVGQAAAKFGRIGAGMTTNELTDVALARQRTLDSEANRLGLEAAGRTMDDRLATARSALEQFGAFNEADQAGQRIDLEGELGRGNLALNRDRLAQDTTDSARDAAQRESDLALREKLGLGGLEVDRQRLGEDRRQFDRSDDFRRLQADRDFVLDDRLAEALAAMEGYDLMGTGITPAQTGALSPEEEAALVEQLAVSRGA